MRISVSKDSPIEPERFLAALTDFTERRPEIWPTLDAKAYRVHSVGETTAEITEGSKTPFGRVWARERYDWSTPGVVTWVVQESNFCAPGSSVTATVTKNEAGGSRVDLDWERHAKGVRGTLILGLMRVFGKMAVADSIRKVRI